MTFNKMSSFSLLFCFCLFTSIISTTKKAFANSLDNPIYDQMKTEFLNVDPQYFSEIVFSDHATDARQDFISTGENLAEARMGEGGFKGWWTYGGSYWCQNETHGSMSLCRYMTGGSAGNNKPICGSSVENSYQVALDHPERICSANQWAAGSGVRLWVGAGDNKNFILPFFKKLAEGPANRLCFEVELPKDRLRYVPGTSATNGGDPAKAQLVNPAVAHANLSWVKIHIGTYTSPYLSDSYPYTSDEETGGTYQGGGSHFYHNPSSYERYPLDKAYALNENTIVACFSPAPSGVRSGMRPPYYYNPLMTIAGDNSVGESNAYAYFPHMSRLYFDIISTESMHPLSVKHNKIFALYEKNDIQALSGQGSVLGVEMIEDGQEAVHPFTIYNSASEDRTYRVFMMAGGNLAMNAPSSHFVVYLDENGNKKLDSGETNELQPGGTLVLKANTDISLLAVHKPNWTSGYQVLERYGRKFAPAGITLQEVGRLRMTSYATRTWLGTAADVQNKDSILAGMAYPSPDSLYATNAQFNQDKPGNRRLVRNTPDYQMALTKLQAKLGPDSIAPSTPTGLTAEAISASKVKLSWNKASDNIGVSGYKIFRNGAQVATSDRVPQFVDTGLEKLKAYSYSIRAFDAGGNQSAASAIANTTTLDSEFFAFINFQLSSAEVPEGYQKDSGGLYKASIGHGWDRVISARERNMHSDQRLDTNVYSNSVATWEYDIPSGAYLVSLSSGDADVWGKGPHRVVVEGVTAIDDKTVAAQQFISANDVAVTVNDGRLTVAIGGAGANTYLNYITIKGNPSSTPKVCGNGFVDPSEECDDRNVLSGDGCSDKCKIEAPPTDSSAPAKPKNLKTK